jgi:hypothetical protein
MDVATIVMPADEARAKLDEYRAALAGRDPTDEDSGILIGYRALAAGKSLLDLHGVFRSCPVNAKGQPALAVARAHWRRCVAELKGDGSATFWQDWPKRGRGGRTAWHRLVNLPRGTLPDALRPTHQGTRVSWATRELRAVVPLIPANLRPAAGLNRYVVLWEADWEEVPVDPMLLRHAHGSLYVVLAAWDLTSLERAVLAGRLTER